MLHVASVAGSLAIAAWAGWIAAGSIINRADAIGAALRMERR